VRKKRMSTTCAEYTFVEPRTKKKPERASTNLVDHPEKSTFSPTQEDHHHSAPHSRPHPHEYDSSLPGHQSASSGHKTNHARRHPSSSLYRLLNLSLKMRRETKRAKYCIERNIDVSIAL
jgi:hypothetical protein